MLISLTQEQDKRTGPAERSADLEEVLFNFCDEDENGNDSDDLEDVEFYLCDDVCIHLRWFLIIILVKYEIDGFYVM